MRKLNRQVSSLVIVIALCAALATSFAVSLRFPDAAGVTPPTVSGEELFPTENTPLSPSPDANLPLLITASVVIAALPISVSFLLEKTFSRKG